MTVMERIKRTVNKVSKVRLTAQKATADLQSEIAAIREAIAEREREIRKVEGLPVDNETALRRWFDVVDRCADDYTKTHQLGPLTPCLFPNFGDRDHQPLFPDPTVHYDDLHGYLCLFFGDLLKQRGKELLNELDVDTITDSDRTERIKLLQSELDELLAAESDIVKTANDVGIEIGERSKVIEARNAAERDARRVRANAERLYKQAVARLEVLKELSHGNVRNTHVKRGPQRKTGLDEPQLREQEKNQRVVAIYLACERAGRIKQFEALLKDTTITVKNIEERLSAMADS